MRGSAPSSDHKQVGRFRPMRGRAMGVCEALFDIACKQGYTNTFDLYLIGEEGLRGRGGVCVCVCPCFFKCCFSECIRRLMKHPNHKEFSFITPSPVYCCSAMPSNVKFDQILGDVCVARVPRQHNPMRGSQTPHVQHPHTPLSWRWRNCHCVSFCGGMFNESCAHTHTEPN